MRITQGTFSYLPDLSREQIAAQVDYCLQQGWAVSVEYTDDPHPRNVYWEMFGHPMFDIQDPEGVMIEVDRAIEAHPNHYIKVNAFDASHGWETIRLSFIVNRPASEPGLRLERQEAEGRVIRYSTHAYAVNRPAGERYPGAD
jgi:ribulose-bisphosphate carboxylase small chain